MAADGKQEVTSMFSQEIDLYNMVKDILKYKGVILILAVSAVLLSYVWADRSYTPAYTVEAAYVVVVKGSGNNIFNNLSTAQDTATRFSQIINSATLQNKVAEELGTDGIQGTVKASVVSETNLMMLSVTSSTPAMAFRILTSIMDNYTMLSDYLVGNAILEILMPPSIPESPDRVFNPKRTMAYAFVLTAGGLIALFGAISYMKDTVRRASDVERKLDAKLLGTVSHEEKRRSLLARLRRRKSALLVTNPTISFRYAELFLKTSKKVQDRMDHHGAKTLLVNRYMENGGKSTVAANLALTLAQSGKRVCLVDADLRKPSQYKIFEQFNKPMNEFIDVLNKDAAAEAMIGKLERQGIYTVFNTRSYQRSIDIIASERMRCILEYLKLNFDYVIIDTPPMALVADTEELAGIVDASLMVVKEHGAPTRDINDAIDALNGCSAPFLGCIFNDAHKPVSGGSGYGYGYGNYGYGKYYSRGQRAK